MKKFGKSLIALLMGGAMCFSVGCGNDPATSGNSGTSTGGGTSTGSTPATTAEKAEVYNAILASVAEIAASGDIYKITMDVDVATGGDTMGLDGALYFQYKEGSETEAPIMKFDGTVSGVMDHKADPEDTGEEAVDYTQYMYATTSFRDYTMYFAMLNGDTEIDPSTAELEYMYVAVEDLMAMFEQMMGSGTAPDEEMPYTEDVPTDGDASIAAIEAMISKAAKGFLQAINGTVTVDGSKTTLTIDVKKEIEDIGKVAEELIKVIGETTTVNDLLTNTAFKAMYSKYFGTITAEEIAQVMSVILGMDMPAATDMTAYDYLVSMVASMPVDETTTVGQMPVGEMKEMIDGYFAMYKEMIATVNELKISMSLTDNVFSGFAIDVDITDIVDMSFAISLEKATYTFLADSTFADAIQLPLDDMMGNEEIA